MKKLFMLFAIATLVCVGCSDEYDDSALRNDLSDLENRVSKLEELCKQMNTNISSLQTIVTALQNNDYVTGVTPVMQSGKEVGYTITFSKSNPITIFHGKDGANGSGHTPVIGVKKDTDGIYYWTLDGEFIVVDGQKIKAQGTDGSNGADGNDGQDGKDGITPKLEIREGYWWISYDNGKNWTQLGKATGEDGKDGDSIKITQDENNVYFELADGTIITIARSNKTEEGDTQIIQFKDAKVKAICVQNWDTNDDGELSYGEAAKVTSIRKFFRGTTIQSFDELQYFTGIDEIGTDAFRQCKNLTNITIPQNVIWIEEYAFSGCNSLNYIIIPKDVTWIGNSAFSQCNNLTNIIIPNGVTTIGANAFYGCNRLENITIPNSVTTLGNSVFQGCTNLTTAIISNNITIIESTTFSGCTSLTTIEIPASVETIKNTAFNGCTSLTSIEIPASVETIEEDAFLGCSSLKTVTFEKGSKLKMIQYNTFRDCTSLTTIEIPASVETVEANAFNGCTSLKTVTFEKGSQLLMVDGYYMDNGAFVGCRALTTVDMSACTQVTEIGDYAFSGTSKLQLFKIGTRTPPSCEYNVFMGINSYSVLKVPAGCVDAYKNATGWKEFTTISELDE